MYRTILVAVDGSYWSDRALEASLALAAVRQGTQLIGCHVYAARLHKDRFEAMEPGLPDEYHEADRLNELRSTHEALISDGMKLISDAYLDSLAEQAHSRGLSYLSLASEGRNYTELLRAASERAVNLVVLGVWGQGRVPESQLGSVAERVLLYGKDADVLLVKQRWSLQNGPIVVGIDGSPYSYAALERAVEIAQMFETTVKAVAIYDPFFHKTVFHTTADALPPEAAQRFNFQAQQLLHDEIIDQGLDKLYRSGLEQAAAFAHELGMEIGTEVLAGKVYPKLCEYAASHEASLVVAGRWGLHCEPQSLIGGNALNLARLSPTNTLFVSSSRLLKRESESSQEESEPQSDALSWTPDAERMLQHVPFFARRMARKVIEKQARERGLSEVTLDVVREISRRFGMGQ